MSRAYKLALIVEAILAFGILMFVTTVKVVL